MDTCNNVIFPLKNVTFITSFHFKTIFCCSPLIYHSKKPSPAGHMSVACTMWSHLSNQNITIMLGKSFLKLYFTTTSCQILINYVNILKNNLYFKKNWFLTNIIMWPFHCYLFYSIFPWNQHITKITKPKLSHTVTNLDEPDTIPETQHTFTDKCI